MPRTAADDVAPSPFPTISPSLLLAVMLRCAFMQLSVMCCMHFTIMLRLVAATVAAAACGAACLCYCFCCGAKRCSLLLLFFSVALLPLLLLFCLSSSSACCGNSPLASCLLPLPPLAASACFCRFLVFNIHLKLSCPLLAPGCPGSPSPPPLSLPLFLPLSTVLRVLFLHSDYVDCSAVPVDPSLLIVCLTE